MEGLGGRAAVVLDVGIKLTRFDAATRWEQTFPARIGTRPVAHDANRRLLKHLTHQAVQVLYRPGCRRHQLPGRASSLSREGGALPRKRPSVMEM